MNEQQPSNLEAKIVEFTAHIQMYDVPPRKINDQEKAELKKLKVLVDKLTADPTPSTCEILTGNTGEIEQSDALEFDDMEIKP